MTEPTNVRDIEYLDDNFPRGDYDFCSVSGERLDHWVAHSCADFALLIYGYPPDDWCDHNFVLLYWNPSKIEDHGTTICDQGKTGYIRGFVDQVRLIVSLIK